MDKYARSFRQGLRRPILLLLLLIMSFVFYATTHDTSREGGSTVSYAQSSTSRAAWLVKSFIWSRDVNAWARTNCTMTIGGLGATVLAASSQSYCSNTSYANLSFLQYYHDIDPDDTTPNNRSDDVYGKIKGRAWSPFYGVIYFDPSDFPSAGAGASCYGLTGNDRQPRIERPEGGNVRIVGCAYVPLLRDYILFNRSGATHSAMPSSSEWGGVHVLTVENVASAYLVLRGCAWSASNGFWAFGSNQSSTSDGKQNCLPSGHNTKLKAVLPESRIGSRGGVSITVSPTRTTLKIGQEVRYQYLCPSGYNTPTLRIGSRIISTALALFRGYHSEIFTDSVSDLLLTCTDGTNVFTSDRSSSGAIAPSTQNSFFISSFAVTPSVLTEGGFVSFGGFVSNQGSFADRVPVDTATGHCDNTQRYGCIYGVANETVIDDSDSLYYQWRCDGVGNAAHSGICQIPKDSSPAGLCDNTVRNGCMVGTPNDAAVVDIPAYYRWQCDGVNGGKNSGACQFSTKAVLGNEGYCTITNKITKQEIKRFDVDGINVGIPGTDVAVRDAVYDLQCRYKRFKSDGTFEKWQSVSAPPVTVKVLPRSVSERNVSGAVDPPVFSVSNDTVSVTIPPGAAMVYVYRLNPASSSQVSPRSLYKIFVDRDAVELSNSETVDELKVRLFESAVRSRVVVVGSRSGGITKSAAIGKSLVAAARTVSGVWSQQTAYTFSADGSCDESLRNGCIVGAANDEALDDSSTHYRWRCDGIGGGRDSVACEIHKPIDGGWSDWALSPDAVPCANPFTQTRACNNPTPAHGGVGCSGSSSRPSVGTQCRYNEVCRYGSCELLPFLCPAGSVGPSPEVTYWEVGSHRCLWRAPNRQPTLPGAWRGDRYTLRANTVVKGGYEGFGSLVFECRGSYDDVKRSNWKTVATNCGPVSTACDTAIRNGCFAGTAVELASSSTHYKWRCDGVVGEVSVACEKHLPVDGDWGDWTPSADTVACGTSFAQTRSCDSPAPAYGGVACSGSPNRRGVGEQCSSGRVCENNVCVLQCSKKRIDRTLTGGGGAICPFQAEEVPVGRGTYTLRSKITKWGTGSIVFECRDSGWVEVSNECTR